MIKSIEQIDSEYKVLYNNNENLLNSLDNRTKIHALEAVLKTLPQADLKLFHYFSPGVYARELHIPADCTVVGEIHKYPQLNILSKGKIRVSVNGDMKDIEAPFTVVSPAGTKRVAYAYTDCVWTTILHTDETNISAIEKHFIAKSEEEYLEFVGQQLKLDLN